jgi:antitoxin (DNA-binding transcriptional repressor) of toxin-antitoxin stability system
MSPTLLNTRELSKSTARVLRDLPKTGPRVITRGNKTVGILIPAAGDRLEEDLALLRRMELGRALGAVQREAVLHGSDRLTMAQINAEIRAARKARRKRQ